MKKFVFTLMAVCAALTISAQSGWWAGGSVGYWHDKSDADVKTDQFVLSPEVGYDINSNWSLAMGVGIAYAKVEDNGSATAVTFDPYARYKFYKSGPLTLFIDGGFGVATADADGWEIGLKPGLSYNLSKKISAVAHVGFLGYKKGYYNGGDGEGFGFNWDNTSVDFGIYYAF
jgi:long-subunit fatty acid transport protein